MRVIQLFVVCLMAFGAVGQDARIEAIILTAKSKSATGITQTFYINEGFEGSGVNTSAGWWSGAAGNWDGTPALSGNESLYATNGQGATFARKLTNNAFYGKFQFRAPSPLTSWNSFFDFIDPSWVKMIEIVVFPDKSVILGGSGCYVTSTGQMDYALTNTIWFMHAASGTNELWWSSNGVKPSNTSTNHIRCDSMNNVSTVIQEIHLLSSTGVTNVFDNFQLSDSPIP